MRLAALVRRLGGSLALALVASLFLLCFPRPSFAATTQLQAYNSCKTAGGFPPNPQITCAVAGPGTGGKYYYQLDWYDSRYTPPAHHCCDTDKRYYFDGAPGNPCTTGAPQMSGGFSGKILAAMKWCKSGVPALEGGTVSCGMSFTPGGPPTMNQWGSWHTPGTLVATGSTCDGSGGGSNNWQTPTGQPAGDPVPPSPASTPPAATPPKACGGVSCYDAAGDQFCATSGGKQFCVPGGAARGDQGGANAGQPSGSPAGACASSGDSAVCAGSPTAPLPPPASVPDPATAITGHDTFTQANPATGANQAVVVNTYTNQGAAPTTSGQASGDSGPAPASSSPSPDGDKGSASGGGDCNTPPVCTGDAPTCMVVSQSWLLRCGKSYADTNGDGQPDWTVPKDAGSDGYDVSDTPASSVFSTESVSVGSIDSTSWAGNSCPALPVIEVFGKPWSMDQGLFCDWLALLRSIFLLVAGFVSVRILASGGKD